MSMSHLEAFDLIAHAEIIEQRLVATLAEIANDEALVDERTWLEGAHRHLAKARGGVGDLLVRALRLPELEPLRGDRVRSLQSAVIEALDGLQSALTAAVARTPLVDLIYRNLKPATMIRANREAFERFCDEIERRLSSSYIARMLADESYASVAPALAAFRSAVVEWKELFGTAPIPDEDARALRSELEAAANRIDLPLRQARLIAEAALLSKDALLTASGLLEKPKRRAARASVMLADSMQPDA